MLLCPTVATRNSHQQKFQDIRLEVDHVLGMFIKRVDLVTLISKQKHR